MERERAVFGVEEKGEIIKGARAYFSINENSPDILFIALGAPKQEKWIFQYLERLQIKVAVCIGAGVDYLAGTSRRAPQWTHGLGLGWFWRLCCEPGRLWKRYLIRDSAFLGLFWKEWRHQKAANF